MAFNFHANQFEGAFKPTLHRNWEIIRGLPAKPRQRTGFTRIIANDRGHLLPGIARHPPKPQDQFLSTWQLPKRITRTFAESRSVLRPQIRGTNYKHCVRQHGRIICDQNYIKGPLIKGGQIDHHDKELVKQILERKQQELKEDRRAIELKLEKDHGEDKAKYKDTKEEGKKKKRHPDLYKDLDPCDFSQKCPADAEDMLDRDLSYIPGDLTDEKFRPDNYDLLRVQKKDLLEENRRKTPKEAEKHEKICERFESHHNKNIQKSFEVQTLDEKLKHEEIDAKYGKIYSKEELDEMKKNLKDHKIECPLHKKRVEDDRRSNDQKITEELILETHRHHSHKKHGEKMPSNLILTKKNFEQAKKCARENLEHQPLPDKIDYEEFKKAQMEGQEIPGLSLPEEINGPTGVAWKQKICGPTQCTKMRIYRSKTAGPGKLKVAALRPGSCEGSFDLKWRFIKQKNVTPIELAICWDMRPENPKDEPERPKHIDGSNGSAAPAVFQMVASPKEPNTDRSRRSSLPCDGVHGCGTISNSTNSEKMSVVNKIYTTPDGFRRPKTGIDPNGNKNPWKNLNELEICEKLEKIRQKSITKNPNRPFTSISKTSTNTQNSAISKIEEVKRKYGNNIERPKTSCNGSNCGSSKDSVIQKIENLRNETKQNHHRRISQSTESLYEDISRVKKTFRTSAELRKSHLHKSSPNLISICDNTNCKKPLVSRECRENINMVPIQESRPKSEYKMAFKAGVPISKSSSDSTNSSSTATKEIKVPKQREPYAKRNYAIKSLSPPFSMWKGASCHSYPEHWRLASVYQHSYKPVETRKCPLLQTVYQ